MAFRNYIAHKFNLYSPIDLKQFQTFIKRLNQIGTTEIELVGRRLTPIQRQRTKDLTSIIHDEGMKVILYTGPFGKDNYKEYAQRDKNNNPLSLMCPSSKYIDNILLPELNNVLEFYDGLFLDMPWIMKGGCYCNNCDGDNEKNVRDGLKKIRNSINIRTSINAGAPTIHNEHPSAHIDNIKGIFDEYVTEWNPLRWNQKVSIIKEVIEYAKKATNKKIYHATTCTDKQGKIYPLDVLTNLFTTIISAGAIPRLGIAFNNEGLNTIGKAMEIAYSRSN